MWRLTHLSFFLIARHVPLIFHFRPLIRFQVAVLTAKLEGKDMELESIKEDNGDMLQKVKKKLSS